jgi:hypothetical protein
VSSLRDLKRTFLLTARAAQRRLAATTSNWEAVQALKFFEEAAAA